MDSQLRLQAMDLISEFEFATGIVCDPEIGEGDDPRHDVIHPVADHPNGVIFTPGALLDSHFRASVSADGRPDPEAVFPPMGSLQPGGRADLSVSFRRNGKAEHATRRGRDAWRDGARLRGGASARTTKPQIRE